MCGFAGIISFDDEHRFTQEDLAKMSRAIAHRGPDGEGFFLNHTGPATPDNPQVGLAFRRLAILDPDPRSDQPFTDGRRWLVFNGEIYNFRELKKQLSELRPDYVWRTTGDTEVLLMSYAVWGETCVEKLNGMFAFAVWDTIEKSLFLARDRMGQKPLYFQATESPPYRAIAFASEIGSLRELAWFETRVNTASLANYLRYGCIGGRGTAFAQCFRLRDEWDKFVWGRNGHAFSRFGRSYFDPNERVRTADQGPVAATRSLVRQSVERQLVSDVPLGIFLSGGVDSSVIAACARRVGPIQTFAITFDDPRYDESDHAAAVAKHLGTEHHTFRITPDAVAELPKLAAAFGEPFADSSALPTHYLARETRRHVTVALSGDGGDELFGGYNRYRAMRFSRRLAPLAISPVSAIGRWLRRGHPKSRLTLIGRLLVSLASSPADQYDGYMRLFDNVTLAALWPGQSRTSPIAELFGSFSGNRDVVQTSLAIDRVTYLPDDLLVKVDRCSMLHGLEVRSPFMDHELVQFAAGLTTDQLLKGGPKRMLREAFADDLPAWVFKRKKMGFAVPIGDWFRGPLRAMLRDTLFATDSFGRSHFDMKVVERLVDEHETKRVDHSQRLYALLMLELWWKPFKS